MNEDTQRLKDECLWLYRRVRELDLEIISLDALVKQYQDQIIPSLQRQIERYKTALQEAKGEGGE